MATYNTAFGALPSPKTLTGATGTFSTDEDETKPRNWLQQYGAQQQSQTQTQPAPQPASTMTFAQMQEAGQARPAPPPAAPAPAPAPQTAQEGVASTLGITPAPAPAAAEPTMLNQLATTLAPPASVTTPTTPPPVPTGYRPAGRDVVETPLANIDQYRYSATNPPPSNAPNGSTFTDGNNLTWTKRAGIWVYEASSNNNTQPTGYAALSPFAGQALPSGFSSGFGTSGRGSGLDQFLTQYGIPETDAQWRALAANSNLTVEQLRSFIASNNRTNTINPYVSQSQATDNAAMWRWFSENGPIPSTHEWVPPSQGGPGIRPKSGTTTTTTTSNINNRGRDFIPPGETDATDVGGGSLAQSTAPQSFAPGDPNGPWTWQEGWQEMEPGLWEPVGVEARSQWKFENGRWVPTVDLGSNTPYTPPKWTPTTPLPPGYTPVVDPSRGSFPTAPAGGGGARDRSNLLSPIGGPGGITRGLTGEGAMGGMPLQFGEAPTFAPSQGAQDIQAQLRAILTQMQNAPSPYDSDAYKAQLAASEAELAAQYGAERSKLEEQLARQGLSASTFGAGRYGDLAGQQARAQAGMRAELLKEAANQQAERQQVLLQGLTSLSGQMGQQEIAKYQADLDRYRTSGQFALDAERLQQDARFRGVELTLQEARDLAENQYRENSLKLQLEEIISREGISGRQISSTLLAALIPNLDLSGLTQDQLRSLFAGFGLNLPASIPITPTPPGTPTTPRTPSGSSQTLDVQQAPTDLSPYAEGTIFRLPNGTMLQKRNGVLIDVVTGRVYDGRE